MRTTENGVHSTRCMLKTTRNLSVISVVRYEWSIKSPRRIRLCFVIRNGVIGTWCHVGDRRNEASWRSYVSMRLNNFYQSMFYRKKKLFEKRDVKFKKCDEKYLHVWNVHHPPLILLLIVWHLTSLSPEKKIRELLLCCWNVTKAR